MKSKKLLQLVEHHAELISRQRLLLQDAEVLVEQVSRRNRL